MANTSAFCDTNFKNENLGKLYIIHGSLYFPLYAACMTALCAKPLFKKPCYKIMSAMGIMDLVMLTIATYVCGYWSIYGTSFCDYWLGMKIAGSIINGGWVSYSCLCVVLGLNRALESTGNQGQVLRCFGGNRVWFWVAGCFSLGAIYMLVFLSPYATVVYHSGLGLFLFDPQTEQKIALIMNTVNNVSISICMIFLYSIVCMRISSLASNGNDLSEHERIMFASSERRILIQSFIVCSLATLLAVGYVTIPLFTDNIKVYAGLNIFWQFVQGSNGIIYITLNKAVRHKVLFLCQLKSGNQVGIQAHQLQDANPGMNPVHNSFDNEAEVDSSPIVHQLTDLRECPRSSGDGSWVAKQFNSSYRPSLDLRVWATKSWMAKTIDYHQKLQQPESSGREAPWSTLSRQSNIEEQRQSVSQTGSATIPLNDIQEN